MQQVDKPLPIVKMSEKFQKPESGARNNVAKRTYYVSQDTIRVDYHIPDDHLTNSYRIYCKDGHSHVVEMDPLAPPLDHMAQLEQFQELLQAEKDCTMVGLGHNAVELNATKHVGGQGCPHSVVNILPAKHDCCALLYQASKTARA
jgi:hypothetical protein